MKKVLSFIVLSFVAMLPFAVSATSIQPKCGTADANGIRECTIVGNVDPEDANSLVVKLTEHGGAEVTEITNATNTDWAVSDNTELNGVWTVNVSAPGTSGEVNLFAFKFKESGQTDCKISISLGDKVVNVTPEDVPTDNKDTGSTLPYVALAFIAVGAVSAYLVTKNKSKMYRI